MRYFLAIVLIVFSVILYAILNWITQGITLSTGVALVFLSSPLLIPLFMLIWMKTVHPEVKTHKTIRKIFLITLIIVIVLIIINIFGTWYVNRVI